jgi:hypothetical protein
MSSIGNGVFELVAVNFALKIYPAVSAHASAESLEKKDHHNEKR